MKKIYLFIFIIDIFHLTARAQVRNIHYSLESQGILTSEYTPFWLKANHYGNVPSSGTSISFVSSIRRDYDSTKTHLLDWGASLETRGNVGKKLEAALIEGYGKVRIGIFELKAGRAKEIIGLTDSSLSSGAFAVSGNALGIPKAQLAVPKFYDLPVWRKLFAVKGSFAHGWMGKTSIQYIGTLVNEAQTYFHHKSLYGRLGRPNWKVHFYGGFNHQVMWGNEQKIFGDGFDLSRWQSFKHVISGKTYKTFESSKFGNHLGSIDVGLEYDFKNIRLLAYRQNFYEVGALRYLANLLDGLNGVSLINKKSGNNTLLWQKVLFEFLYTKNQAGESWSRYTPSGDENYYNNYMYAQGWSYKGVGLGNSFLSTRTSVRNGLPNNPYNYFINNRVLAFHIGAEGSLFKWKYVGKLSYSKNYGTYGTSALGHSIGNQRTPPAYGIFQEARQLSTYLEVKKDLKKGLTFGGVIAFDYGRLYNNSAGMIVKLIKSL